MKKSSIKKKASRKPVNGFWGRFEVSGGSKAQAPVTGVNRALVKLAKRALEIKMQLEEVKPLYEELDEITMQLVGAGATHWVDRKTKLGFEIVDNFEKKNTCWRAHGIRRWELKVK